MEKDGAVAGPSGQNNKRRRERRTSTEESETGSTPLERNETDLHSDSEESLNSSTSTIKLNDSPNNSDDSSTNWAKSIKIISAEEPGEDGTCNKTCPVCYEIITGDVYAHVDFCTRQFESFENEAEIQTDRFYEEHITNPGISFNTGEGHRPLNAKPYSSPDDPEVDIFSDEDYEKFFGRKSTLNAGSANEDSTAEAREIDEIKEGKEKDKEENPDD